MTARIPALIFLTVATTAVSADQSIAIGQCTEQAAEDAVARRFDSFVACCRRHWIPERTCWRQWRSNVQEDVYPEERVILPRDAPKPGPPVITPIEPDVGEIVIIPPP